MVYFTDAHMRHPDWMSWFVWINGTHVPYRLVYDTLTLFASEGIGRKIEENNTIESMNVTNVNISNSRRDANFVVTDQWQQSWLHDNSPILTNNSSRSGIWFAI